MLKSAGLGQGAARWVLAVAVGVAALGLAFLWRAEAKPSSEVHALALPAPGGTGHGGESGSAPSRGSSSGQDLAVVPTAKAAVQAPVQRAAAEALAAPPRSRPGYASIVGRAVDPEGRRIRGARVRVRVGHGSWVPGSAYVEGGAEGPIFTGGGTTDATGRFRIDDVPAGRWKAELSITSGRGRRKARSNSAERVLYLSGAQEHDTGDHVLRPTGSLSGSVVDEDGSPVARAQIAWLPRTDGDPDLTRVGRPGGKANAKGRFTVADLPCKQVYLSAIGRGVAPRWRGPFTVTPGGEDTEIELIVEAGRRLRGRLVDEEADAGVAGRVILRPVGRRFSIVAEADADGRFTAQGIRVGEAYRVSALARGYENAFVPKGAPSKIQITEDHVNDGLRLGMRRVELQPLLVVDTFTGRPVAGALVSLSSDERYGAVRDTSERAVRSLAAGATGADGVARLRRGGVGTRFVVSAKGYGSRSVTAKRSAGAGTAPMEVTLLPASSLVVTVTRDGAAVANATVVLEESVLLGRRSPIPRGASLHTVVRTQVADASGRAEFSDLSGGSYAVRVAAPESQRLFAVRIPSIRTEGPEVLSIELGDGASLTGTVAPHREGDQVRATRGMPTASDRQRDGAVMSDLSLAGYTFSAPISPEGTFSFENLTPGSYVLTVHRATAEPGTIPARHWIPTSLAQRGRLVTLGPESEEFVELTGLESCGQLSGNVTVNGRAASHRQLRASWIGMAESAPGALPKEWLIESRTAATDAQGGFEVKDLEPGLWIIQLLPTRGPKRTVGEVTATVASGETASCSLQVETAHLEITVVGTIPGSIVTLRCEKPEGDARYEQAFRVATGTELRVPELPPGAYVLEAPGLDPPVSHVQLAAREREELELSVPAAATPD